MNAKNNDLTEIINHQQAEIANLRQQLSVAQTQTTTSNLYLNNILADLPEHVFWMDKEGRIIGCNEKQAKTFGLASSTELKGKNIYDVAKGLDWDKTISDTIRQNDAEIMQTGKAKSFEETVIINGQKKIMLAHKKPLFDEQGNIIGIIGTASDITERKKLENDLKIAEAKASDERILMGIYLENIISNIPEYLYWVDKNNILLGCNDQQAINLGSSNKQALIGKSIIELGVNAGWNKDMINQIHLNNIEIMKTGITKTIEEKVFYNGEQRTVLSYKKPLINRKNEVIGLLGITIDITERKQLEKKLFSLSEELTKINASLEQKIIERTHEINTAKEEAEAANRGKTEFLGVVSHELYTPLRAIDSSANGIIKSLPKLIEGYLLAKKEGLPVPYITPQQFSILPELLNGIQQETTNSFKFIQMLLNIVNQQNETGDSPHLKCSMNYCLDLALGRYPYKKAQKTKIHRQNNQDFLFDGNELLMVHVIFNLLKNALQCIQETGKGEINIWLESNAEYNILHFKDTSKGISKEILPYIFDRYYSKSKGGSGIGLAFCRMVITGFNGTISCNSKLGEYTEFLLAFPIG